MFFYDNKDFFEKEEKMEFKHRIFRNLPLLERQIFGHTDSYQVKKQLLRILVDDFPAESVIEETVRACKKFSRKIREEEKRNNISTIKHIFVGEKEDEYLRNDEGNDDSIMADVDRIDIIKRHNDAVSSYGAVSEFKSQYGTDDAWSRKGEVSAPIELGDSDEGVSDFEEPPSAQEEPLDPDVKEDENRDTLKKLYEHLNSGKASEIA